MFEVGNGRLNQLYLVVPAILGTTAPSLVENMLKNV